MILEDERLALEYYCMGDRGASQFRKDVNLQRMIRRSLSIKDIFTHQREKYTSFGDSIIMAKILLEANKIGVSYDTRTIMKGIDCFEEVVPSETKKWLYRIGKPEAL